MANHDPAALSARAFIALQHLLPQHWLTGLVHRATRSRAPLLKNRLIASFCNSFHPDMSDAEQPDPLSFESFNAFFTRALRAGARPADADPAALVSPVDGTVSQAGALDGARLLQAKGHDYTLEALLDESAGWPAVFAGGSFATLYLAPYNYHRIHMPLPGTLRAAWYVPGDLFSVNATTAASVAGLFARNERVVCIFEHGPVPFAMVLVGALFVGSMSTVWHGDITPRRPRRRAALPVPVQASLAKSAEMGRFNMGSTVILLLPPGAAEWLPTVRPGATIRVGQSLARLR
ncbi:MAG: phosphatidylserine decarboxylase [Proteobacteria bacterium]|nr:phosphatidylserine decarboxylase [Pseudomonadota bacterium]